MKVALLKKAGVNKTMQGHHKTVSAVKALRKEEKTIPKQQRKFDSAKSESKQSNKTTETKHIKTDKQKNTDHKTNQQNKKKKDPDQKIIPFSTVVFQAISGTNATNKSDGKAGKDEKVTSKNVDLKENPKRKSQSENSDKKTSVKNISQTLGTQDSDKPKNTGGAKDRKDQQTVNKEIEKKNKTQTTSGNRNDNKSNNSAGKKESEKNTLPKFVISDDKHAKSTKNEDQAAESVKDDSSSVGKSKNQKQAIQTKHVDNNDLTKSLKKAVGQKQSLDKATLKAPSPDKSVTFEDHQQINNGKAGQTSTLLQPKSTSNTNITTHKTENNQISSLLNKKANVSASGHSKGNSQQVSANPSNSGNPDNPKNQQNTAEKSGQNGALPQQKLSFKANILPGKIHADRFSPLVNKMLNIKTSGKMKGKSNNSSNDTYSSGIKLASPTDTVGRKAFSQQFAQQISQSFTQQMQSSSKQMTVWKHHRLQLQNGKSIHIVSRNSNGVLQLQLQAGNNQLGKILQQHLQEIQQHVQQQLNIDINLQLQDFGKQQQGQQYEEASSLKQPKSELKTDESISVVDLYPAADSQHVRYFGFNRNEWTA
jgi:hypothetical protein